MAIRASFSVIEDFNYPSCYFAGKGVHYFDYSEGCAVFVDTFLAVATDLVPVDTGALRDSIIADTDGEYIECEAGMDYAQYVEYGTYKMAAQPYFEPALEAALEAAKPYWDEEANSKGDRAADGEQNPLGGVGGGGGIPTSLAQLGGMILGALVVGMFDTMLKVALGLDNTSSPRMGRGSNSPYLDKMNIEIT